ncbi:MAG TPA: type II secretion system F family protein [Chthoniobacteraceae bacterium]|nr:type II secretion system F family protein [Chthoniobacteraceae bacterium]
MYSFAYQARDTQGKIQSGVTDALNEENAINSLMSRGLMVTSIQQKSTAAAKRKHTRVSETDLVLFTRQLATMVDAGLPLVSALTALYEQSDPRKQAALKAIIGEITARVQQGDTFNEAIAKHPRIFSRLYISMVRAGETGGMLAEILDRLAGFLESSARLRKKIKSAMTYPAIVISIAFAITLFLVVKVVPVFAGIFADFGSDLPAPTQLLITISDTVRAYWFIFLFVGGSAFFGIRHFLQTERGEEWWDRTLLKLPVFGPLTHKVCMSRFARTFAQLIRSGVPILEVMSIVGETAGNVVVSQSIKKVSVDVEKGDGLAQALTRQPIFPPMMLRMVAAGEATGKIDAMLEKMADFWDEEIEALLNALTSLLEPFLIVFLGLVVGGIVIAMFLPLFKLNDVVSGSK